MTEASTVFDAAKLLTAGGATVYIAVQMAKAYFGTSPRATVAVAALFGSLLTLAFAVQANVLDLAHAFDLIVAAFAVAATGSGISAAADVRKPAGA